MIVTSCQQRVMITRSQLTRDVGALSLESSYRQGMQRNYETYSNRIWPFCQSNCTPLNLVHRNDKLYAFSPNHRRKWRSFAHVDLCAPMFSFPSCIAVDSSDRLFHDLSTNYARPPACSELCAKPVRMWNRLETGCPSLPKQRFKHNALNTSCHVHDKDGDINLVLYRTEKKIYSFLTMCKQWHVSCK